MLKLLSKKLPALFAIASIILVIVFYYSTKVYSDMHRSLKLAETETIVFTRGSTIRTLANTLIDKGLLENKRDFLLWGKFRRQATRLQAGEYQLTPGMNLAGLLNNMVAGNIIQYNITLIEGFTFEQILQIIKQNPVVTQELQ